MTETSVHIDIFATRVSLTKMIFTSVHSTPSDTKTRVFRIYDQTLSQIAGLVKPPCK